VRNWTVWIAWVLVGVVVGAVIGWFLGAWLGDVATRGCIEMDCLESLLWVAGAVLACMVVGGTVAGIGARRHLRGEPPSAGA
jgi:membrane protein YqaA with SNARE-associated domain